MLVVRVRKHLIALRLIDTQLNLAETSPTVES